MGQADFYRPGSHNVICMRCGFKRKAEDIVKEWTGLLVCRDTCADRRNPQDFVRGVVDNQSVTMANPEPDDTFLEVGSVTADDL